MPSNQRTAKKPTAPKSILKKPTRASPRAAPTTNGASSSQPSKPSTQPSSSQPSTSQPSRPSPPPPSSPPPSPRTARNRQLALHHATLLQQRKDAELNILSALETLIDSPSSLTTDPTHPSPHDATRVKTLMLPFQPSDFDSLVEERNIDHKCGYVLCPRPPRTDGASKARFRIVHGSRGDAGGGFKVVKKGELEKWCGDECGKFALYLRVQMSEVPAWERAGGAGGLELYGEVGRGEGEREEVRGLEEGLERLALERGERSDAFRGKQFAVRLKENDPGVGRQARPPDGARSGGSGAIDGYVPKAGQGRRKVDDSDGEEDEDDDDDDVMDML